MAISVEAPVIAFAFGLSDEHVPLPQGLKYLTRTSALSPFPFWDPMGWASNWEMISSVNNFIMVRF